MKVRLFVHDEARIQQARRDGRLLRLEYRGGAATIRHPSGMQRRAEPKINGKAAVKQAKRERREARERIAAMDAEMKKGGAQ